MEIIKQRTRIMFKNYTPAEKTKIDEKYPWGWWI